VLTSLFSIANAFSFLLLLVKIVFFKQDWSSELYPKFTFHHVVRKLEMIGPSKDAKVLICLFFVYRERKQQKFLILQLPLFVFDALFSSFRCT